MQARHRGWLSNASVCAWQLVGCDEEQRVKSLSLDYTNLHGTLPASLGALRRLEALDLEGNFLSGTVPRAMSKTAALRHRPLALQHAPPALDLPRSFGQFALLGLKYGLTNGLTSGCTYGCRSRASSAASRPWCSWGSAAATG